MFKSSIGVGDEFFVFFGLKTMVDIAQFKFFDPEERSAGIDPAVHGDCDLPLGRRASSRNLLVIV